MCYTVGCIFGELLSRLPMFAGNTELEQLSLIVARLGNINESEWPV